ncbi:hypothetical protein CMQ_1225 [Grosmannia clavigera kw1407]|uniref:Uncharacterized protein n=1 Tax=Grosmannia clavigera (strain kw1407 / UAMH 11150) TaxID=655863 RepID=F0XC02_GROCL|nr:uncharacterized protein CMQ_1225 [Grosmannia clavigera kw1407]EFX04297.1 hypothetical protein CMQ_1225 [Grosmannia clavigera kw1407]
MVFVNNAKRQTKGRSLSFFRWSLSLACRLVDVLKTLQLGAGSFEATTIALGASGFGDSDDDDG